MEHVVARFKAMGSPCELRFYGSDSRLLDEAVTTCYDRIGSLEQKYSRYLDQSIVSEINASAGMKPVQIDQETYQLCCYASACFQQSDGLFDITSGVLRKLWNRQITELPNSRQIASCLSKVGFEKLQLTADTAFLTVKGMEIDFGGIVKEYASDVVAALARRLGVAAGVVNLGGDLSCFGVADETWRIGVADPRDSSQAIAEIDIESDCSITTSGSYERFIEINGCTYSHLLDPRSGWPVKGLVSVSIVANQAVVAGSLATIAMLKPAAEAVTWLESLAMPYLAVDHDFGQHGPLQKRFREFQPALALS